MDYIMRQSDPVLAACAPIMDDLVIKSGLDCILSAMVGDKVVDTHRASSRTGLTLKYGRGRPRSLFLGSSAKILLANKPRTHLMKIYMSHKAEIAASGLGTTWPAFRSYLSGIRDEGFYFAMEELEKNVAGGAVPISAAADGPVAAALALVGPVSKVKAAGERAIRNWLTRAGAKATEHLKLIRAT
jgi:DNA-binding IclR family transcriptional regulator